MFLRRLIRKILAQQTEANPVNGGATLFHARYKKRPEYTMGAGSYGIPLVRSWERGACLTIGKFCAIGRNVQIYLDYGVHDPRAVSSYPFSSRYDLGAAQVVPRGDVTIGHDVWLGNDVVIMAGVTIGSGVIIGASAVVTRDVPPYAIVAGNPATVVRQRGSETQIAALLDIAWWDWPEDKIERFAPLLMSRDLEAFIAAAIMQKR